MARLWVNVVAMVGKTEERTVWNGFVEATSVLIHVQPEGDDRK